MYEKEMLEIFEAIKAKEILNMEHLRQVQANIKELEAKETELEEEVDYYQEKRDEAWAIYNLTKNL